MANKLCKLTVMLGLALVPGILASCLITPNAAGNVVIPADWTEIPIGAFVDCISLKTVVFEAPVQINGIGNGSFANSGLTTMTIPNTVTDIGSEAFSQNWALTTLNFETESTLAAIGYEAFYNCRRIKAVTFPLSVVYIGEQSFYQCNDLVTTIFECSSKMFIAQQAFVRTGVDNCTVSGDCALKPQGVICYGCGIDFREMDCSPTAAPTLVEELMDHSGNGVIFAVCVIGGLTAMGMVVNHFFGATSAQHKKKGEGKREVKNPAAPAAGIESIYATSDNIPAPVTANPSPTAPSQRFGLA